MPGTTMSVSVDWGWFSAQAAKQNADAEMATAASKTASGLMCILHSFVRILNDYVCPSTANGVRRGINCPCRLRRHAHLTTLNFYDRSQPDTRHGGATQTAAMPKNQTARIKKIYAYFINLRRNANGRIYKEQTPKNPDHRPRGRQERLGPFYNSNLL